MSGGDVISCLSSPFSFLLPVKRGQVFGSGGNGCECSETIQEISHQDVV